MNKLEVGQYWHDPKDGDEWLVKEDNKDGKFTCECVSSGETAWFSGEIVRWYYDEFIESGYVLGRHPDNIERVVRAGDVYEWIVNDEFYGMQWRQLERYQSCIKGAGNFKKGNNETDWDFTSESQWKFIYNVNEKTTPQSEQWQLKEGDLVWNKGQEFKAKVVQGLKGELYYLAFDDYGCERMYSGIQRIKNLFEPYTDQDKKIDFSKSGQWLSFGDSIVKTCGKQFPETFGGHYLGQHNTPPCEFRIHDNWQLLTHEQMQPLLDAIEAITESQSD